VATEWNAHWTVDQAVQGYTILTEIIVFNFLGQDNVISQCRSTTRTISNYNVPAKYMLQGSRNTPSCPMLQKLQRRDKCRASRSQRAIYFTIKEA